MTVGDYIRARRLSLAAQELAQSESKALDVALKYGYENDGEKIIGYQYNNGFEPGVSLPTDINTPVTWGDWENNLSGYILLQNKVDAASERSTALALFRTISDHARKTEEIHGRKVGFAAWESFLYQLEHDDFTNIALLEQDAPTIDGIAYSAQHRFFIYCDALCQIYARKGALPYYRSLAQKFPEWQEALGINLLYSLFLIGKSKSNWWKSLFTPQLK